MNREPLVSVISVLHRASPFLSEAIESVLAQTYTNWELLLVNCDLKTDGVPSARQYAAQRPDKIRYLEHSGQENRGMSASRNQAVQQARGELLALLNPDDVWRLQKLEREVAALGSQPQAAMVYGPTFEWYGWTGQRHHRHLDHLQDLGVSTNALLQPPQLVSAILRKETCSPHIGSVLLRHEAVTAIGGFEEHCGGLYEDELFFSKIGLRYPVFVIPKCYDKHRRHETTQPNLNEITESRQPARLSYLNWLANYLEQSGAKNDNLWAIMDVNAALKVQRWPLQHPWLHSLKQTVHDYRCTSRMRLGLIVESLLPISTHEWVRTKLRGPDSPPRVGRAHLGSLRRLTPISRNPGSDRGQPVDRFYIEQFLAANKMDIRGNVLEIGDDLYTRRFGNNPDTKGDVLHVAEGSPKATIEADLTRADQIPDDRYDCILLVHTLPFIYDTEAALQTAFRILKPGGVLLATVSGISHRNHDEWEAQRYWDFTTHSVRKLMETTFPHAEVHIAAHGNVLAATALLHGLAAQDLRARELRHEDPQYELVITVRAVKSTP